MYLVLLYDFDERYLWFKSRIYQFQVYVLRWKITGKFTFFKYRRGTPADSRP